MHTFSSTTLIKLVAVALVALISFSAISRSYGSVFSAIALVVLLSLLDASQVMQAGAGRDQPATDADLGSLVRRLLGIATGPFYIILIVILWIGTVGINQEGEISKNIKPALAADSCCGAGASGGFGALNSTACSCSTKSAFNTANRSNVTSNVTNLRTTQPIANLPGINGRPLPQGIVPKSGVALPPGVQATPPKPDSTPSAAATPAISSNPLSQPNDNQKSPANSQQNNSVILDNTPSKSVPKGSN